MSAVDRLQQVRPNRAARAGDAGFTLMEVLVSMMIFAIISAAAVTAVISGIHGASATDRRVGTSNIAQQTIQQAQNAPRATLAASPSATSTVSAGSVKYRVTRTVTFAPTTATACPTTIVSATPYAMRVLVDVVQLGSNGTTGADTRSVHMETVLAC